jgi:hypothetical protein
LGSVSLVLSRPVSADHARTGTGGAGSGWSSTGTTAARTVAVKTLRITGAPGMGTTAGYKLRASGKYVKNEDVEKKCVE